MVLTMKIAARITYLAAASCLVFVARAYGADFHTYGNGQKPIASIVEGRTITLDRDRSCYGSKCLQPYATFVFDVADEVTGKKSSFSVTQGPELVTGIESVGNNRLVVVGYAKNVVSSLSVVDLSSMRCYL